MQQLRKPWQGVGNIVRFNWHFYALASALAGLLLLAAWWLPATWRGYVAIALLMLVGSTLLSLLVSAYVYDWSNLYRLDWLADTAAPINLVSINAGFDETSHLLAAKFNAASLTVLDFYDLARHTEVSIKRARRVYPAYPGTQRVVTSALPVASNSADKVFSMLAAHEIRNEAERTAFFQEVARILKPDGQIIIVEHLRDQANFLAYNIGFFHFHSRSIWLRAFSSAGLSLRQELKITPFVTAFIVGKDGIPA
jgi:SAM-dependent methyltransferase